MSFTRIRKGGTTGDMKILLTTPLFILALLGPLYAGADLQKGLDAISDGDYRQALNNLKELADQGNAKAQYNIGVLYQNGDGVPQSNTEATHWYRLAANQGNVKASFNLGVMYGNAEGRT